MILSSVCHIIYRAAGMPPMVGDLSGRCRLCGEQETGQAFTAWVKDTFTDHDKLTAGTIICQACQFCTAEAAPGLADRLGKDKQQKMRNYSHFVCAGVWHPLSKGVKGEMRRLLMDNPAVAVIADSGQKHLLPWARVGWWTFELEIIRPFPALLTEILSVIEPLYQGGITKAEIETGRYSHRGMMAVGLGDWRKAEDRIRQWRGGLPLQLALFLAQREEASGSRTDSE